MGRTKVMRMSDLKSISIQELKVEEKKEISSIFLNFDIITLKILHKFYFNDTKFPNDTNCYYLQQLFSELKSEGFTINSETLRKRLETLVKLKLIEKIDTYPRIYMPVRDVEKIKNLLKKVKEEFL
ncbi:MAG: hypothetical protein QW451_01485 [Candidatus Aenigmatarchaeota archaeon]